MRYTIEQGKVIVGGNTFVGEYPKVETYGIANNTGFVSGGYVGNNGRDVRGRRLTLATASLSLGLTDPGERVEFNTIMEPWLDAVPSASVEMLYEKMIQTAYEVKERRAKNTDKR